MSSTDEVLESVPMFVGGRWESAHTGRFGEVFNPSTGRGDRPGADGHVAEDALRAVEAASKALPAWSETPAVERARVLFRFRERLVAESENLARLVTREHGKTLALAESRGLRSSMAGWRWSSSLSRDSQPSLMGADSLPNIAREVDCETVRHPVGVCVGITPFNFPMMVPLWMIPVALARGLITFVLKLRRRRSRSRPSGSAS